jgi:hypothetical protein
MSATDKYMYVDFVFFHTFSFLVCDDDSHGLLVAGASTGGWDYHNAIQFPSSICSVLQLEVN